jgi:hypothetical protein
VNITLKTDNACPPAADITRPSRGITASQL